MDWRNTSWLLNCEYLLLIVATKKTYTRSLKKQFERGSIETVAEKLLARLLRSKITGKLLKYWGRKECSGPSQWCALVKKVEPVPKFQEAQQISNRFCGETNQCFAYADFFPKICHLFHFSEMIFSRKKLAFMLLWKIVFSRILR